MHASKEYIVTRLYSISMEHIIPRGFSVVQIRSHIRKYAPVFKLKKKLKPIIGTFKMFLFQESSSDYNVYKFDKCDDFATHH